MDQRKPYQEFQGVANFPQRIVVIGGAGYVGVVTAAGLAYLGYHVLGMDISSERLALVREGLPPYHEPALEDLLKTAQGVGRLAFTDPRGLPAMLADAGLVFIAVDTPRLLDGKPDLSHILQVASELGQHLDHRAVIVLKSTAPVGSHLAVIRVLEEFGRQEGTDYDFVVNPEFLREGSAVQDFFFPDRIVIGGRNWDATGVVRALYEPLGAPILETTIEDAQMIKYAANAFLAMRVSFINEIANICERVGADIETVARGLGLDRRIGNVYLRAGIGFSGPCLPKDLEGLIHAAEDAGYEPSFLRAVMEKNEQQRRQILNKVSSLLGRSLYDRRIGVLGLTFKPGVDDIRNSAVPVIIEHLMRWGAVVRSYDPIVAPGAPVPGDLVSSALEAAEGADLLLLLTAWDELASLDYGEIQRRMRTPNIVDGVNVLDPGKMRELGFTYVGVGRL